MLTTPRLCHECNGIIIARGNYRRKYCSTTCARASRGQLDATNRTSGTTGAMGELLASYALLLRGWEVFRALSPNCPCDLIAMRGGRLLRIEVRSGYRQSDGSVSCPRNQGDQGRQDVFAVVIHGEQHVEFFPPLPE